MNYVVVRYALSLNAPFGARCFLTETIRRIETEQTKVLMHLLALGAF